TAEVSDEGFTSPLPVRQLPVIDVAAAAATPLTRLAPDSEPLALQPRSRPGPPPVAARPPVQASPERTPSAEPTTTDSSQSRLTLGQSRRLGLGAPLTEIPDRAQLAPVVGTAPVALVAGPVNVQRFAETSPAPTEVLDLAPSLPRGAPDHDSRQTIGPVGLISSGEPDFGLPSAPGLASTIRPQSTASTAPLLSERPLRPASVQRSVEPVPSQGQE